MVDGKKLICISLILIGIFFYNCLSIAMEKPYHHLPDGTFRNPEGSPERDPNVKWSYKIFNQEKKKLDMTVPKEHVVEKENRQILNSQISIRNWVQRSYGFYCLYPCWLRWRFHPPSML